MTEPSNVDLRPAASTATSVTSASPIISADAVDAVRPGFRIALPRASVPAAPPSRVAGQPSTRASGGTSVGASIATPMKSAAAPMPIESSRSFVDSPPTNSPTSIRAIEPTMVSSATYGPKRAKRDGGRTAPSRTAAIGGTLVARIAGRSAAISVIPMPMASETTIVRVEKTVPACGRSMPTLTNSAFSPLARPSPRKSPVSDATTPITNASSITDQRTCRRVAPSVRSVASSRVRCAIVIDSVLAITKAPTNSATPPNASRKSWRMFRKPLVSFDACFACAWPVRTCAVGGRIGRTSDTSSCGETFGFDARAIESSRPILSNSRCAVGRSKIESVAPPSELRPPNLTRPTMRKVFTGPRAITPIVSPIV